MRAEIRNDGGERGYAALMTRRSRVKSLALPFVATVAVASACQPSSSNTPDGCEPPECHMNPPGVEPTAAPSAASPTPAPTASPAVVSSGTTLPPLENDGDLKRWLAAPCFAFSEKVRRFACISAELDMGFVTATFSVLSVGDGSVVAQHTIYEGRSEIDPAKVAKPQVEKANALLASDGYVTDGKPIDLSRVVRTPDGYFRLELDQASGNMMGKRPAFTAADAPDGFKGDPNACMKWEPAGGLHYRYAAALRIRAAHSFTSEAGKPCSHPGELNDETFPAAERWLILRAK